MTQPTTNSATPAVTVPAVAYTGTTAQLVRIEAFLGTGQPGFSLAGLPADSVRHTRDRVYAAVVNSGLRWPTQQVVMRVAPYALPVADPGLDVAIAVALLATTGLLPSNLPARFVCVGGLGLDGSLRPVLGLRERAAAIAAAGFPAAVVPAGDLTTAAQLLGAAVRGADTLRDLVAGLRGETVLLSPAGWPSAMPWPDPGMADLPDRQPSRPVVELGAVVQSRDRIRVARAGLAGLVLSGDPDLHRAILADGPVTAFDQLTDQNLPSRLPRNLSRGVTAEQLRADGARAVDEAAWIGARVVIPEDDEWPAHLPDLAATPIEKAAGAALCLWVRGTPPVAEALSRSVAVVGAHAATEYGSHIAEQLGYGLAAAGWTVAATGGYGIGTAALRGALAGHGTAVAVLNSGVDRPYPAGNADLFDRIADRGLLISAWLPGTAPNRDRFTTTAQLLAALARGTVLVEAAARSHALVTLEQAIALDRPAMVVPGPVTSAVSAGAHQALRQHRQARLVRDTADVIADLTEHIG